MIEKHLIVINKDTIYDLIILQFICVLFAFFDYRILFITSEVVFFVGLGYRFLKKGIRGYNYILWSGLFLLLSLISLLWAEDKSLVLIFARGFFQTSLIGVLLISYISDWNKLFRIFNFYVFACLLLSIRILYETPTYLWGSSRIGGIGLAPANGVALMLAFAAIFAIYLSLMREEKIRYYFVSILFAFIIILSGSRLPLIITIAGIGLMIILNSNKVSKRLVIIPIIIIIFYFFYTILISNPALYTVIGYRIEGFLNIFSGTGNVEGSANTRLDLMFKGFEMFENRPFLGYGLGNFRLVSASSITSHNNYLEILTSLGIMGFILYYSIYVYIIKKIIKKRKAIRLILAIIFVFLLSDLAAVTYSEESFQFVLALLYASTTLDEKIKVINDEAIFP